MSDNFTPLSNSTTPQKITPPSVSKETEPILPRSETGHLSEAQETEPNEAVKPFVQSRSESIHLPPDLKKLGLQPVSSSSFPTYTNVKIPLADDKVLSGLHAPITSSLRWLATLAWYMLKKAHLQIKNIGGRAVRVLSP